MSLKRMYAAAAEVPAEFKSMYVEQDGKFVLDVEGGLEDVSGLKSALGKERARAEKAEKGLKDFTQFFETPEKAKELQTQVETLSALDPKKEADRIVAERLEVIKKQLVDQHTKEIENFKKENGSLNAENSELRIDSVARGIFEKCGGISDLLMPHIKNRTRVAKTNDGKRVVEILDASGNVMIGKDAKNLSLDEFINTELKSQFPMAFAGSGTSGSEMKGNGNTAPVNGVVKTNDPRELGRLADQAMQGKVKIELQNI